MLIMSRRERNKTHRNMSSETADEDDIDGCKVPGQRLFYALCRHD